MMSRKRIIAMMLAVFACSLAACSIPNAIEEEYSHESYLCIDNKVENRITSIGATWYIDNESFGSTGVINADNTNLGEENIQLGIKETDVPKDSDLEKFAAKIEVTEVSGETVEVTTLQFPLEFGRDYFYELRYEGDDYFILHSE